MVTREGASKKVSLRLEFDCVGQLIDWAWVFLFAHIVLTTATGL